MKPVRLRHDGPITVYMVPDSVAKHLKEYCLEFCTDWLVNSPEAARYRISGGLCYGAADFIEYLNTCVFPEQPSYIAPGTEPVLDNSDLPKEYRSVPYFNF